MSSSRAIDAAHEEVFGEPPGRDVTRWFSDASALTRYGIPTVNYGTSTGLMDVEQGENLEIDGLVQTAEVYARVAMTRLRGRVTSLCRINTTRSTEDERMKLVTFGEGQGASACSTARRSPCSTCRRCASTSSAAGADETGERVALADDAAARADRPEEVLPHRRQLPRARGGVEARRLVARRSRRGSSSSRTSTRSSAPTSRSSTPST